jgi:glycosyltransferase involved in cell wall biosynthesis
LTYRRPKSLARLLAPLADQVRALDGWRSEVVVVDNDPLGLAVAVVANCGVSDIARYVHEPRPGIAAARNRTLDEAVDADVVVFIDDDEIPGPGWLRALLGCWEQWDCAAVSGPVRPDFAAEPGEWVRGSGMFSRRRRATGTIVDGAPTNNLLLDMAVVRARHLRFDERFGVTGGEDTYFARTLADHGETIRWCDEAEVIEPVATERATRGWVLRRAFRTGTTWSAIALARTRPDRRWWARSALLARAAFRLLPASAEILVATVTRSTARRAAAEVVAAGRLGMLLGAGGYVYREYRRPSTTRR